MKTRIPSLVVAFFGCAALAAENATISLTASDKEAIKQVFGGESVWRIEGSRMSHDGGAGADIYGTVTETDDGFCAARHAIISGRVEDGRVTWEEEPVPQVTEVVWPPQVREGRPCSEMVSEESIRLLSPVESNTLARLIDAAPELALDASLLLEDSASPSFVTSGQITTIEVEGLVSSGVYSVSWMLAQCKGFTMSVETDDSGEFRLVNALRILC